VESLGGKAWAEFTDTATTFAFSLPVRRASDLSRVVPEVGAEAAT
jgi:hypothetical protein